jgi:integral membrane protein (TIGR01906 family)
MERKLDLKKVINIILIISIFNLILLSSLFIISFNENYYLKSFEKNNIYERLNYEKNEIDNSFKEILLYLKNEKSEIKSNLFNERETEHLKDVKNLFNFAKILIALYSFLLIVLIKFVNKNEIKEILKKSSYLIIGFISLIGISMLINFEKAFIIFHKILFTNDLWILYPSKDNLIIMMPEILFINLGIRWIVLCLIVCLILLTYNEILKKFKL